MKIRCVDTGVLLKIEELTPYEKNARRHTSEDVKAIMASIKELGFNDPIGVWSDKNVIVEGHGRLEAAKRLGMKEVPCIRLDALTDDQRRAYALAHNKTAELSEWDFDMLGEELESLEGLDFDMEDFGFEIEEDESGTDTFDTRDPSCQHNVFENQELRQFPSDSFYGMPEIRGTQTTGDKMLRFMDWKEVKDPENYIAHFYYDDYKFINAWREPEKYLDRLRRFKAVVSPDFSVYTDFPRALQILACYRRQWCGAYWEEQGLDVIPDVVWGDKESFDYCFDGLPKHSTVAVSTVGVKADAYWNGKEGDIFRAGYDEMMKRLEPTTIIFYGEMIEGCEGNIIRVPPYYRQKFG